MADPLQPHPFVDALHNKIKEVDNLNNQVVERRIAIIKQVFSMLLTPEGRLFIRNNTRFRNVLIGKIYEFGADPRAINDIQFLGLSENLIMVISEEQRLLNL